MTTPAIPCRHCTCAAGCCAKERLLNTCARLLLSCGCESVTTRRLAEEAEVNHTLIAYHFGGMAQLTNAAVHAVEARLQIELVPEIQQFTASLATAAPDSLRLVFEDACARLVEFLLLRAPQTEASRWLLAHRTCTHKLYHLYDRLLLRPVLNSLCAFLTVAVPLSSGPHTAQNLSIQANILLSQLLFAAHMASTRCTPEETILSIPMADPQQTVRLIVRSVLASLDSFAADENFLS